MICCIPWVLNVATRFQFAASSQLFSAALQIQVIFLVKLQHQSITPINVYTSYILLIVMIYCINQPLMLLLGSSVLCQVAHFLEPWQIQVIFLVRLQCQSISFINVYTPCIFLIAMICCIPWVLNVTTRFQHQGINGIDGMTGPLVDSIVMF